MTDVSQSEWGLAVPSARIGPEPVIISAEAEPEVCEGLARRFDILGIDRLRADVTLRRLTDGDVSAVARIAARLSQACVVTLEPVEEEIAVTVEGRFSERTPDQPAGDAVVSVDPEDESDEPEPIVGGMIHLGEWLAQQVSLAMDPYPRAPGAAIDPTYAAGEPDEPVESPFARLARLRGDRGEG